MIKVTAKNLAEYFCLDARTIRRYVQKNGGLKEFNATIQTIIQLEDRRREKEAKKRQSNNNHTLAEDTKLD